MVDSGSNSDAVVPEGEVERLSSSDDLTLWKEGTEAAPHSADARIGCLIGQRYRIEGVLGEGGMGRVYKAVHVHMRKDVALKVLRPEMMAVPGVLARFEREAIAAGRISHPNVVAATDFGRIEADGAFYLVLEYVNGRDLRQELKHGALTVPRAVRIATQVCEALVAAHQRGVIHRDLKPENIMLVDNGGVDLIKVLDFGIAKLDDPVNGGDNHKTRMGLVMGTPRYMSPEQGAGAPVDHRTDLYSLGVILYEMLAGTPPFGGGGVDAVLAQHLAATPPKLPAHVDVAVANVVFHLLEKDARARPASAQEALVSLRRLRRETARPADNGWPSVVNAAEVVSQRLGAWIRSFRSSVWYHWRPVWSRLKRQTPWRAVLERRVHLGRQETSLATLVAVGFATFVAIAVWSLGRDPEGLPSVGVERAATDVAPPASATAPTTASDAREELDDLLAIPVYKRDRQTWLSIASGHAELQEWRQSVAAYRNALQLEPKLKDDRQLLQRLRDMALLLEVYDAVANIALNLLGEPGMDLLYDVWLTTKDDPAKAVIAAGAEKSLGIFRLRSASRTLRVTLALHFAKRDDCAEANKILTDALEYADERAVTGLTKLRQTTGCGVSKKRDCYACIRLREKELEAAITRAEARRAPRFDGTQYVPAK